MSNKRKYKRVKNLKYVGYDALASTYDSVYGQNKKQEMFLGLKWLATKLNPKSKVLDIGSGTGKVARYLSNRFEVLGIDNSPQMLSLARENVPDAKFLEMNFKKLNLDEDYAADAILAFFSLIHVEKSIFERILDNILKHLKIGGFFIISMILGDFDDYQFLEDKKIHYTAYSEDELLSILESKDLKILRIVKQDFSPKIEDSEIENQIFIYCQK